jgi:hypothetical protein
MSTSENCKCCGKSFKRIQAHLVRSVACESYYKRRPVVTNDGHDVLQDLGVRRRLYSRSSRVRDVEDELHTEDFNFLDDGDHVLFDDEYAFPCAGDADDREVSEGIEGVEGPDVSVLDLYLKLFKLRANPLGLSRFSREEEVLIELLQVLRDLHCPLKAFEIILKWAAKSNGRGHTFRDGVQPTRKKVIANLYERYNMNGLIPKEKRLYLPHTQRIVSMIFFDASEVFASLLSCPTLNQDSNFFFDFAKDPFVAPLLSADVGDIHTGRCYRKTYNALIKKPGVDMLLPCVMAMDKTHIDMTGRLQMEPITISHGLLNHDKRRLPTAMRILGYINHSTPAHLPTGADVDAVFNAPINLPEGVFLVKDPLPRPDSGDVSWATLTLNEFHMQIQFILEESGFLRLQNRGFRWNLHYNQVIYRVVFHPYVPFIIGDTEGHDRLCGHYTARFSQVQQLCRICECPTYLTGYSKSKFPHRLPKTLDALVKKGLTDELKAVSQNYLRNGFAGVRFGTHSKRGIFGACPGEMLHLISLGWFKYCLQAFSAQAGPTSQALKEYDQLCAKLGVALSRQSDRDVPRMNFPRGFSSGSNLMGHEMAGCLLVKLFALHTTCFRTIFGVGKKEPRRGVDDQRLGYENHVLDWTNVVTALLVWHQWMKQPTISKKMVKRSHATVQWLMRYVAEVAPRPAAMGNNTIKTHLVLHLCEDILDHGVPETVNSSYAESAHIPLAKVTSRNTQKRAVSFTKQAAHRYVENLVVSLASSDVKSDSLDCRVELDLPPTNAGGPRQCLGGRQFDLTWNRGDESPVCRWTHPRRGDKLETAFLPPIVLDFLSQYCLPQTPRQSLPCFTSFTNGDGEKYRAHPDFDGKPWNDFAMIKWEGIHHNLPALIHTFVDLRGVQTMREIKANGQSHLTAGLYAVVHTFDALDRNVFDTPNILIGHYKPHFHSTSHERPTLFLVDVNTIASPLLGTEDIPPLGKAKSPLCERKYLFLIRRKAEWHLAWDSLINAEHHDIESNADDDTWFEEAYEKNVCIGRLPSGRRLFSVKTPDDNAGEVAVKKAAKLAAKKKKEEEVAAKKRRR